MIQLLALRLIADQKKTPEIFRKCMSFDIQDLLRLGIWYPPKNIPIKDLLRRYTWMSGDLASNKKGEKSNEYYMFILEFGISRPLPVTKMKAGQY